ncbi:tropomyosin isoforms a/b/d/f-like [Phycodurus eques]|uniref:tropomyosin isoforms a/b/d/f-like n=1 Tax=Phycodurus eques TaxID=693459 RepID=UPI002ACD4681|nr:tropomyosin isoforms a/b/d/f-like [Phycodurus eques]
MATSSTESDCILKWKNRKLMEKAGEFNNLWASDIQVRNQKVEATQAKHRALEEKLDTINKENVELLSQQKIYEAKIFLLTQKRNLLENQVSDLKALEVKMKKRISDLEEVEGNLEQRLAVQAEQHKENIKKTEDKIHNRFRDKERALQAKTDAQRIEMENMEKRVQDIKDENSTLKQELKRAVQRYEKDREAHRKMTAKIEFDYQVDLRTAKMKNKVLTDRVETLSTTTEDKVKENEALRERLKSKTLELEKKRVENADLLIQIEALTEKLQREQKRTATLNERVTRLEKEMESMWNKYEIEQKAHLFTKKHSGLVLRKHNDLLDRIKFLDHRIKSQQASIQKLESHVSAKSTFIRNISLDIETSMSLVNDPKKFIKEIIRIKAKLFADDKDSHLSQMAELVFQAVESQKSRFDRYDTTIHNLRKQLKQKELHMLRHIEKIEKPRSELIKIVNEQRRELAKLKSEMNQVTHTLREVNSYLPHKVQLWVKHRISGAVTTVTPIH